MSLIDLKEKFERFNYEEKLRFIENYNIDGFFLSASYSCENEIIFDALINTSESVFDINKQQEEEKKDEGKEYKVLISICPQNIKEYGQFMSSFIQQIKEFEFIFLSDLKEKFIIELKSSNIKNLYLDKKFDEYKSKGKDLELEGEYGIHTLLQSGKKIFAHNYYSLGSDDYLDGYSEFISLFSFTYFQELYSNGKNSTFDWYKQKLESCYKGYVESQFFAFLNEEKEYYDLNRKFKCLGDDYSSFSKVDQISYGKNLKSNVELISGKSSVPITVLFLYYSYLARKIRLAGEEEWKTYFTEIGLTESTAWVKYYSPMKGEEESHLEMRIKYYKKGKDVLQLEGLKNKYKDLIPFIDKDLSRYKDLYNT